MCFVTEINFSLWILCAILCVKPYANPKLKIQNPNHTANNTNAGEKSLPVLGKLKETGTRTSNGLIFYSRSGKVSDK